MKKNIVLTTLVLILTITLLLSVPTVLAGNKNQNDETNGKSVERGTGKQRLNDGCAPPTQSGSPIISIHPQTEIDIINVMLADVPPGTGFWQIDGGEWIGGPCCPSNEYDLAESEFPLPNQCCNGPEYMGPPGSGVPGNHCLCFELRGWPIPLGATWDPNPV